MTLGRGGGVAGSGDTSGKDVKRTMRVLASLLGITVGFAQDWGAYGGDSGGTRYSTLRQIRPDSIGKLKRLLKNSLAGETACPTCLQTVDLVLVAQVVPPAIATLQEFFSNFSRMAVPCRH